MYRGSGVARRWLVRPPVPADYLADVRLPPLIRQLLYQRGVGSAAEARRFLLQEAVPASDPTLLPQAEEALSRLRGAIAGGEAIAVYGDFDVDGITAAALLTQALREVGAAVIPYIPDRFSEGYGLNVQAISALGRTGATVLLAADCGTSSVAEVAHAHEVGMSAIVLDHHTVPAVAAAPLALVNPKRHDSLYPFAEMASVGLAYRLMEGLYEALGRSFPGQRLLDLVALGTVADVVPLVGENRYLVRQGLQALVGTERPGLRALAAAAGLSLRWLDVEAIGYGLAPRLNAAGRLAHGSLSFRLLTTTDEEEGVALACQLDELNRERQRQTERAIALAEELLEREGDGSPLIFIGHAEIPEGIVGLVAGRLAEEGCRPAVVYHQGERESRGSARSVPEMDMAAALRRLGHLMVRFGGHHQAAGFTVANEKLPALKEGLRAYAEEALAGVEAVPTLTIDAEVPLRSLRGQEIRWLRYFQPCGAGNPEPTFLSRGVVAAEAWPVGAEQQHLRLKLRDGPVMWPAIAFRRRDVSVRQAQDASPWLGSGQAFDGAQDVDVSAGQRLDVVYSLRLGSGQARSTGSGQALAAAGREEGLELRVHDLRSST
ncbi:MAG: single-stranded-DNA-specific exonuclease RecJ [Dehalococcoidia bacterium]